MADLPIKITREDDDPQGILRASIGGKPDLGYYLVYRGDEDELISMLRKVLGYADDRLSSDKESYDEGYAWEDSHGGSGYDWESLYPQLLALTKDQFRFEIKREKDDGRTFSGEAIENLGRALMSFVLARCHAYWQEHGEAPRDLAVDLNLTLGH